MRRSSDGHIFLMDFSAAVERRDWARASGAVLNTGTPMFAAPEALMGEDAGVAADIYSLGVVLYRLVTGKFPYTGRTVEELSARQAGGEMTHLIDVRPDLPGHFIKIVERALSVNPADRYASAGEMGNDLGAFVGETIPPPSVVRPGKLRLYLAAALLIVPIAGWLAFHLIGSGAPLRVSAEFYRLTQGTEEPLASGASVYPGDRLFLEIEGSAPMYVYVLSLDSTGEMLSLFPIESEEQDNPLESGLKHKIPGVIDGATQYWELGYEKGGESFYVIASKSPLPEAQRILELTGRAPSVDPEPRRGVIRRVPGPDAKPTPSDPELAELMGRVIEISGKRSDVWYWQILLENQGL